MQRLPKAKRTEPRKTARIFLSSLARDARGSTLAIVVAALIPLIAMIGSGIEMSRIYMAKTRLQSACDAASLAGRRVMTNDMLDSAVTNEAVKFFRFNFPDKLYDTATFTPTVTKPESGTIRVQASTTIPSAIMYIFGHNNFALSVDCSASQNFVNTDVVLVLDVTGSMADNLGGTSKISALRDAVLALYDELRPIQTELEANGMRLRYGIVPYSSAVNVGGAVLAAETQARLANPSTEYFARDWKYQSRQRQYKTYTLMNDAQCAQIGGTSGTSQYGRYCEYWAPAMSRSDTIQDRDQKRWYYAQFTWPVGDFLASKASGVGAAVPSRDTNSSQSATWDGCIEERQTVDNIRASTGYAIPSGANDLNIDMIPSSAATRWGPHWPEVVHSRNSTAPSTSGTAMTSNDSSLYACPAEAVRLKAWTRTQMQTYVNSLQPIGGTYHDIGMLWGARFISSAGIFGADNPDTYNSMPVSKHIIFMTDGQLAPNTNSYTSYGIEELDQRVTGNSNANGQYESHEQRFKMICNSTRGMNVSIWVIAFGTTVSPALNECASNPSQVSTSTDRAQLIAKFTEIGKNIGALRLTQ